MDYIIQPEIHSINLSQETVQFQVYSSIDQKVRSVNVNLNGKSLGLTVRIEVIKDYLLELTNVLKGSPLEKAGVQVGDYIVGVVEQPYSTLKGFIVCIKNELDTKSKSVSVGVYSVKTGFKIIKVEH